MQQSMLQNGIEKKFVWLRRAVLLFLLSAAIGCASGGGGSGGDSGGSGGGGIDIDTDSSASGESNSSAINALESGLSRDLGTCAAEEPDDNALAALNAQFLIFQATSRDAGAFARDEIANIPVYFHVISKGDALEEGQVPDEMLIEQIDVLNRGYSGETGGIPTPFRFQLAGINRVRNEAWFDMVPGSQQEFDMKSALHVGGPETLNIYTVNTDGKILGFASFPLFYLLLPSSDGVVINYQTVPGGSFSRYNIGHVAVHEVGHWLGLLHTFQGECGSIFGDLVTDTPAEALPEQGQFCPVGRDSCVSEAGADPVNNHMTYTDDACRSEFTQGQLDLMRFNSVAFRGLAV